jgi:hypothetical protein
LIIDELIGVVNHLDDESALVTLTARDGEKIIAEYPADLMKKVGRRFSITVEMKALPELELDEREERAIHEEVESLLSEEDVLHERYG